MSHCQECISRIDLYLDDELRDDDLEIFNRHIAKCPLCWEELAQRRRFLEQIRAARPLHVAPPKLRASVAGLLAGAPPPYNAAPALRGQVERTIAEGRASSWLSWIRLGPIPALVACGLIIAGTILLWKFSLTQMRSTALVDMALKAHRQQLAGDLPLEMSTSSPTEMSAWFEDKVPFHFRLPTYDERSGQESTYKLSGGRLVTFGGDSAAYVAYRMKAQLISLIVVSASTSVASGGERTVSGALTFHTHRKDELQVVTWSVHNLTYALVSAVNLPAGQSCTVCHARTKERNLIRDFKTRNKFVGNGQVMLLSAADIHRIEAVR